MKKNRLKKYLSIKLATNPGQMVLYGIVLFNVILFLVSSLIIRTLNITGAENMSIFQAAFYALRMIMSGNIDFEINYLGIMGVVTCFICVITMVLGTIFFTGSLIAYLTNAISAFMSYSNPVGRSLSIYDHIVILGWNTRAPEIFRNLLYSGKKHEVVILTSEDREKVKAIIDECIADAIIGNNLRVKEESKALPKKLRAKYIKSHKMRNRLVIMIRHGETFSSQQLKDVALSTARAVIVLGENLNYSEPESTEWKSHDEKFGNAQLLKTVMQVIDIATSENSANDQNIIVEVYDDMTLNLINKVVDDKRVPEKCSVIPVPVSRTIGSLVTMFALTPSLGQIYNEIFTIGGMDIFVEKVERKGSIEYVRKYLNTHVNNLPLNYVDVYGEKYGFYAGIQQEKEGEFKEALHPISKIQTEGDKGGIVNDIIVIGHSSKLKTIVSMIDRALSVSGEKVRLMLADDRNRIKAFTPKNFEISSVYSESADARDFLLSISDFILSSSRNVSIVLLSDDLVSASNMDDETIANLIRVKEILNYMKVNVSNFSEDKVQIVVELINPTHFEIVKNLGVKNIIISNRLTSKMITQFAFESSLFELYRKMISKYGMTDLNSGMEIFTQYAKDFFKDEIPQGLSEYDLVRSVFEGSITEDRYLVVLGLVDEKGNMQLFDTDRRKIYPSLTPNTLMICYRGRVSQ